MGSSLRLLGAPFIGHLGQPVFMYCVGFSRRVSFIRVFCSGILVNFLLDLVELSIRVLWALMQRNLLSYFLVVFFLRNEMVLLWGFEYVFLT